MASKNGKAAKIRASKTKVSWMPRHSGQQRVESVRKAWLPVMGKPTGNYSPMEAYLRRHEPGDEETVGLMADFQKSHKCGTETAMNEIARLRVDESAWLWYGCPDCGNVHRVKAR